MNKKEKHARKWSFLRRTPNFLNWFEAPKLLPRIKPFVKPGNYVVDLGCGWGYYSFLLADLVGENGKVYAVDLGETCKRSIDKKSMRRGYHQIITYASTAADLSFITDGTIDFVFSNGLFCSMENDRMAAVDEIKRVLKPHGHAYISLGAAPPLGLMDENEWNEMLSKFTIIEGGKYKDLWVIISNQ